VCATRFSLICLAVSLSQWTLAPRTQPTVLRNEEGPRFLGGLSLWVDCKTQTRPLGLSEYGVSRLHCLTRFYRSSASSSKILRLATASSKGQNNVHTIEEVLKTREQNNDSQAAHRHVLSRLSEPYECCGAIKDFCVTIGPSGRGTIWYGLRRETWGGALEDAQIPELYAPCDRPLSQPSDSLIRMLRPFMASRAESDESITATPEEITSCFLRAEREYFLSVGKS